MKLYKHQEDFIKENPNKALLAWEINTGKTLAGVEWLRKRPGNAIVVCPKRVKNKWRTALDDVHARVLTKEEFKKTNVGRPVAIVFDEAHFAGSGLFKKGRSQISTAMYNLVRENPDMGVLLLTATPICSNPANLHTLLTYIGHFIPWKEWREEFYDLQRLPYLPRPAYMPKPDWRILIRKYLTKYAHIALMSDCIDLPMMSEEVIPAKSSPLKKNPEWEPMAAFVAEHRHEQEQKISVIRELGGEYRKVMIVAHFREQIEQLSKELSKDRKVYVLHGGIDDQEKVIEEAEQDDECYFICQAAIGVGFDAPSFNVMIFASMSYSYVNFVQMKGRITRGDKIKPKKFYYIHGGRCDKQIYKQILLGKQFDPASFLAKNKKCL